MCPLNLLRHSDIHIYTYTSEQISQVFSLLSYLDYSNRPYLVIAETHCELLSRDKKIEAGSEQVKIIEHHVLFTCVFCKVAAQADIPKVNLQTCNVSWSNCGVSALPFDDRRTNHSYITTASADCMIYNFTMTMVL